MIKTDGSDPLGVPGEECLFGDVAGLVEGARGRVAVTVNTELTMLYWGIGKRIREDVLAGERGDYGRQVVQRLADRLTARYGRGYSKVSLLRMVRFAEVYPEPVIVSTLWTQLTWSHCWRLIALQDAHERRFYEALASRDHWSVRTLEQQIQRQLYQRTLGGRDTAGLAADLVDVAVDAAAPEVALRDPYVLDFLGLESRHSEADLERAIIDEMQRFLLELGAGFAFVARQKRISPSPCAKRCSAGLLRRLASWGKGSGSDGTLLGNSRSGISERRAMKNTDGGDLL